MVDLRGVLLGERGNHVGTETDVATGFEDVLGLHLASVSQFTRLRTLDFATGRQYLWERRPTAGRLSPSLSRIISAMGHGEHPPTTEAPTRDFSPGPRVAAIIEGMLIKNGVTRPISLEDQLTDIGLTSLDMANLMLAVEAEFDIAIPSNDLTESNFRSISSLDALIVRVRRGTPPG